MEERSGGEERRGDETAFEMQMGESINCHLFLALQFGCRYDRFLREQVGSLSERGGRLFLMALLFLLS